MEYNYLLSYSIENKHLLVSFFSFGPCYGTTKDSGCLLILYLL